MYISVYEHNSKHETWHLYITNPDPHMANPNPNPNNRWGSDPRGSFQTLGRSAFRPYGGPVNIIKAADNGFH